MAEVYERNVFKDALVAAKEMRHAIETENHLLPPPKEWLDAWEKEIASSLEYFRKVRTGDPSLRHPVQCTGNIPDPTA